MGMVPRQMSVVVLVVLFGMIGALALWGGQASRPAASLSVPPVSSVPVPAPVEAIVEGTALTPPLSGLQLVTIQNGQIHHSWALGRAQQGAGQTPLTGAHKMRVASISKLAVGIGAMQLVATGQLALDDDVSPYLGFTLRNPTFPQTPITLRQLLSHTSSVRDGGQYWLAPGERMADFFAPGHRRYEAGAHFTADPDHRPGDYFTYANLNYSLIAAMMERASGLRFDRYMQERVLGPLGITGASFSPCDVLEQGHPLATLYRRRDTAEVWQPAGPWGAQVDGDQLTCAVGLPPRPRDQASRAPLKGYELGSNPTYFSPQGGLRASAEDIAHLLVELTRPDPRLMGSDKYAQMRAPQWELLTDGRNGKTTEFEFTHGDFDALFSSFGLAVHRISPQDWGMEGPSLMVGHLGEAYGLLGLAMIDPVTADGVVALITGTADDPGRHPTARSPLYRVEEDLLAWWIAYQGQASAD